MGFGYVKQGLENREFEFLQAVFIDRLPRQLFVFEIRISNIFDAIRRIEIIFILRVVGVPHLRKEGILFRPFIAIPGGFAFRAPVSRFEHGKGLSAEGMPKGAFPF